MDMTDLAILTAEAADWQTATYTCHGTLTRPGLARRVYDTETRTEPLAAAPAVWHGWCRVQSPQGVNSAADTPAGGETVPVAGVAGAFPRHVPAHPGDVLTLTVAPLDPALVGVPIVLDSIEYNPVTSTARHWRGHIETPHGVPA